MLDQEIFGDTSFRAVLGKRWYGDDDDSCTCVLVYLDSVDADSEPHESDGARVVRLCGSVLHARSIEGMSGMSNTFPGVIEDEWVAGLEEATGECFDHLRDSVTEGATSTGMLGELACGELGLNDRYGYDLYSVCDDGMYDSAGGKLDAVDWKARLHVPCEEENGPRVDVLVPVSFSRRVGRRALGILRASVWENEDELAKQGAELSDGALMMASGGEWRVPFTVSPFTISDADAVLLVKKAAGHLQDRWGFAGGGHPYLALSCDRQCHEFD